MASRSSALNSSEFLKVAINGQNPWSAALAAGLSSHFDLPQTSITFIYRKMAAKRPQATGFRSYILDLKVLTRTLVFSDVRSGGPRFVRT